MLVLPAFVLYDRSPEPPHRKRILARCTMANGTVVQMASNWPGTAWFVTSSLGGTRMSGGMKTTSRKTAEEWQRDVERGHVRLADLP